MPTATHQNRGQDKDKDHGQEHMSTTLHSNQPHQQLIGQIVHARRCYKKLFFIDLRTSPDSKCTILFRSDDTRTNLPRSLTDHDLVSCWKKVRCGDTIKLEAFEASQDEVACREHTVCQATDFDVLKAWPGDDPFPTEPAMGLMQKVKNNDNSNINMNSNKTFATPSTNTTLTTSPATSTNPETTKADIHESTQPVWTDYCKFWINSQKCLKQDCKKLHPTGDDYARIQEMWVRERTLARQERSKLQDDPHSIPSKVPHSQRAFIFCRWLVDTFGQEYLNSGSGVLDVAGGKGEISLFLKHMFGIQSTVVEPNVRRDKSYQRRNLMDVIQRQLDIEAGGDGNIHRRDFSVKSISTGVMDDRIQTSVETGIDSPVQLEEQIDSVKERRRIKKLQEAQFVVPRLCTLLDDQFAVEYKDVFERASILIGMHPDQATEPIVTMALKHNKPFAVVPCCVFAHENPDRRLLDGGDVNTTLEFIQYLTEKDAAKHDGSTMTHPSFDDSNLPTTTMSEAVNAVNAAIVAAVAAGDSTATFNAQHHLESLEAIENLVSASARLKRAAEDDEEAIEDSVKLRKLQEEVNNNANAAAQASGIISNNSSLNTSTHNSPSHTTAVEAQIPTTVADTDMDASLEQASSTVVETTIAETTAVVAKATTPTPDASERVSPVVEVITTAAKTNHLTAALHSSIMADLERMQQVAKVDPAQMASYSTNPNNQATLEQLKQLTSSELASVLAQSPLAVTIHSNLQLQHTPQPPTTQQQQDAAVQGIIASIPVTTENEAANDSSSSQDEDETLSGKRTSSRNMTNDERRQRRLLRNRVAAKECRKKKKAYVNELQDTCTRLQEENARLMRENEELNAKLTLGAMRIDENVRLIKEVEELNAKLTLGVMTVGAAAHAHAHIHEHEQAHDPAVVAAAAEVSPKEDQPAVAVVDETQQPQEVAQEVDPATEAV
ncbi:hypothetical protein BGZ95_010240 [Linnemannia exigua]|uniref:BZIP domain-containing protein n=1 Tax=Linnemannia exigua TaxID=604196 RepID=A0AAD4DBY3_9FUNG|nr:hypothetical protein BGZ95_010240 [Linnemannia exigua]